jgi:hypothetical protein
MAGRKSRKPMYSQGCQFKCTLSDYPEHLEPECISWETGHQVNLSLVNITTVVVVSIDNGNFWVLGLCLSSGILKDTTFRKLYLFLSSDEGVSVTYTVGSVRIS